MSTARRTCCAGCAGCSRTTEPVNPRYRRGSSPSSRPATRTTARCCPRRSPTPTRPSTRSPRCWASCSAWRAWRCRWAATAPSWSWRSRSRTRWSRRRWRCRGRLRCSSGACPGRSCGRAATTCSPTPWCCPPTRATSAGSCTRWSRCRGWSTSSWRRCRTRSAGCRTRCCCRGCRRWSAPCGPAVPNWPRCSSGRPRGSSRACLLYTSPAGAGRRASDTPRGPRWRGGAARRPPRDVRRGGAAAGLRPGVGERCLGPAGRGAGHPPSGHRDSAGGTAGQPVAVTVVRGAWCGCAATNWCIHPYCFSVNQKICKVAINPTIATIGPRFVSTGGSSTPTRTAHRVCRASQSRTRVGLFWKCRYPSQRRVVPVIQNSSLSRPSWPGMASKTAWTSVGLVMGSSWTW